MSKQTTLERITAARWSPDYARTATARDALAKKIAEVYPAAVNTLDDLFKQMAECDKECARVRKGQPK
jgi:hypothetical protein